MVSIFLNGAHGCSFLSKKNGPPSGEKREGKKAIIMKRFIVFRVILQLVLGQKNLITCQKDVKIRRRNNYLMKILVVTMTIYFKK